MSAFRPQPRAPLQPPAPRAQRALGGHLLSQRLRSVAVTDDQVSRALGELYQSHVDGGFFKNRLDGVRREILSQAEGVEVAWAPNRFASGKHALECKGCALCVTPLGNKQLLWRDYKVSVAAFPYFEPKHQHSLIVPRLHARQAFNARTLGDMLALQRRFGEDGPTTLFFNGRANFSQDHLHWHSVRAITPLERRLNARDLTLAPLKSGRDGSLEIFDDGFFGGIGVTGTDAFVTDHAERIAEKLAGDPRTQGLFNVCLLTPRRGRARMVIIPRVAGRLKNPELARHGMNFGAVDLSGFVVLPKPEQPARLEQLALQWSRQTRQSPYQLEWLKTL